MLRVKRVYDPPQPADGYRVLVDRLWPRGLTREAAALDAWMKDLAPSDGLRRWFGEAEGRWPEFAVRYRAELASEAAAGGLAELRSRAREGTVTLLFGKRDAVYNNAEVLRAVLEGTEPPR
ncbi:DUF488 domain-containing protein [Prosthecomicrobium sp. N25]|uniref:DUF488 domain-containing protein n=1 Tax=Prosthecomicrobium sp. N25 TaxID=3129254 RepID=UPI003076A459